MFVDFDESGKCVEFWLIFLRKLINYLKWVR